MQTREQGHAQPRLIAVMGAECTGKTTLTQALAKQLGGLWVPEYLREFCLHHARTPLAHEQRQIALRQLQIQRETLAQARTQRLGWVVCDTTALQTACYSDYYFSRADLYPSAQRLHQRYALTLLLVPDLPWQADGLQRDSEAAQKAVHVLLDDALRQGGHPSVLTGGSGVLRLAAALQAIRLSSGLQ
jgi:nicotinamide riboside kinase